MTQRIASASVETHKRSVARGLLQQVVERWHAGATPNAREVIEQNPEFASLKSVVVDLAYEEYCARVDAGEAIDREAYCNQFPDFRSSICRRLAVHEFFTKSEEFPAIGRTILGLKLIDELGRGALGRVYLAEEIELGGRLVAVKLAHHGQYEAEFLGRLQHANIVPVHSVKLDSVTGLSAVVMPYLGDRTLADIRTTSVDDTLDIFAQLADALAYTHSQQILHRDLKPTNVLMADRPMLMDFNLSTDLTAESSRLGGTLHYMAPEQVAELSGELTGGIDGRADIYSLGVMLKEQLAGHNTPRAIEGIVSRCLSQRPDDRFHSASMLAAALRRELRFGPRVVRWTRRHPLQTATIATLLICVMSFGGYAYANRPTQLMVAQRMLRDGRPKEAIEQLLQIQPKSPEILFLLGRARLEAGEFDAAYANFEEVYDLTKDGRSAACAGYASCLLSLNPGVSRLWHEEARKAGFDSPEMANNDAYCLRHMADFDVARQRLEWALTEKPALKTAIHNLALVNFLIALRRGGEVPSGIYREALDQCPSSDALYEAAAQATILSDMPEPFRTQVTLAHLDSAREFGANVENVTKSFRMLGANLQFQELLRKPWDAKRLPPIFVSDPLDELPAKYPCKGD